MRVLIDECVDPRVKLIFADHECATVHDEGRDALEDGPLFALAQKKFDVLITIDTKIEFQQNIQKLTKRASTTSHSTSSTTRQTSRITRARRS